MKEVPEGDTQQKGKQHVRGDFRLQWRDWSAFQCGTVYLDAYGTGILHYISHSKEQQKHTRPHLANAKLKGDWRGQKNVGHTFTIH